MENETISFPIYSTDGDMCYYKVKKSFPISRLIRAYTQRIGVREQDIILYVDGSPILDLDITCEIFDGATNIVAGPPFEMDYKEPCEG